MKVKHRPLIKSGGWGDAVYKGYKASGRVP